jgi:hypothetical protein
MTITPSTNRCFDRLTTAAAALAGYLRGHTVHATAGHHAGIGSPISQVCFAEPVEIVFETPQLLDPITRLGWPSSFELRFQARAPGLVTRFPTPNELQRLMGSLYEQAFISYFEGVRDLIEVKHGSKTANWPVTLNFGRVVRNAFAHGSAIDIRDATTVAWRGVAYSRSQNGRQVIYNDLTAGDVTLLMLDMDQLL